MSFTIDKFDSKKALSVKRQLFRTLPESITRSVRFNVPKTKIRARAGFQLVFDVSKFSLLVEGAAEKIKNNQYKIGARAFEELYVKYLYELSKNNDLNLISDLMKSENPGYTTVFQQRVYGSNPFITQLTGTIPAVAERLARMLENDPDILMTDRLSELLALRTYPLFAQTGMGFLFSLLSPKQINDLVYVSIYLPGSEPQNIGNERVVSKTYRAFISARNALHDGDIKLLSELAYIGSTGRTPQKLWNPLSWWDRSEESP
jgi:hypothetical protein